MPTWDDLLEGYVGLAQYLVCTTCSVPIFRGSSGFWGQKLVLNKIAPPGGLRDSSNHAVTFQCQDCIGKPPVLVPVIHASGEFLEHVNIVNLTNAENQKEIMRTFGDYDNRETMEEWRAKEAATK